MIRSVSTEMDRQEYPHGQRAGGECEGRGDLGVRFDVSTSSTHRRLNELRGEAGKVLELVERSKGEEGGSEEEAVAHSDPSCQY